MSSFTINKNGFWESTDSSGHQYDRPLSQGLTEFFSMEKAQTIVDLGCGMGNYTKAFLNCGFTCDAFDGNPNTGSLTNGLGKILDFSKDFKLGKKYDWVLSLEVGEHIPRKFETIFLNNVVEHASTGIIMSWAIPGQHGDGHVNCRTNEYIIRQMKKRGWKQDEKAQRDLRDKSTLGWFKNTIMVFRKINDAQNSASILIRIFKLQRPRF